MRKASMLPSRASLLQISAWAVEPIFIIIGSLRPDKISHL